MRAKKCMPSVCPYSVRHRYLAFSHSSHVPHENTVWPSFRVKAGEGKTIDAMEEKRRILEEQEKEKEPQKSRLGKPPKRLGKPPKSLGKPAQHHAHHAQDASVFFRGKVA